jgi:hypothetical protein
MGIAFTPRKEVIGHANSSEYQDSRITSTWAIINGDKTLSNTGKLIGVFT